MYLRNVLDGVSIVSVPVLGIIFLSMVIAVLRILLKSFRPRTEVYFFIPTFYSYDN